MAVGREVHLTGTREVLANLNKQVLGIKNRTRAGVRAAAMTVKARSQELTPHDTGTLVGSAHVRTWEFPEGPGGVIYYEAAYAPYVHEIQARNYTKPGTQWKFLETALKEKSREIIRIINRFAALRGGKS